mmetsp:Transcript_284/g.517  ORF Transcript_284/g.517 Transcript_284/m.517 type:complete len:893 (+) Transcript_284:68-2746(+)
MSDISRIRKQDEITGPMDNEDKIRGLPNKKQLKTSNDQNRYPSNDETNENQIHEQQPRREVEQLQEKLEMMDQQILGLNNELAQKDIKLKSRELYIKSREQQFLKLLSYASVPAFQHRETFGTAALQNLGNTCFMNAVIQCLTKVTPLKTYMIEKDDQFERDLNRVNRLGYSGDIAMIMRDVFKNMYNRSYTHISPRALKFIIGKHKMEFQGDDQHDAMEFASFIINGIHEDLNRAHLAKLNNDQMKQYREQNKERDDSNDHELPIEKQAEISWNAYLSKNQSVINDHFAGQHVHTVECRACSKTSYNFQAYNSIHVPVNKKQNKLSFVFVPSNFEIKFHDYDVQPGWKIKSLRQHVASTYQIPIHEIIIVDIYEGTPYDIFKDDASPAIEDLNLYVYHIPHIEVNSSHYEASFFSTFYVVVFKYNKLVAKDSIPIFIPKYSGVLITDILKSISSFLNLGGKKMAYFDFIESTCFSVMVHTTNLLESIHSHITSGTTMPEVPSKSIILESESFPAQKGYQIDVHLKNELLHNVLNFNKYYNPSTHAPKVQLPLSECIQHMLKPENMEGDNCRTCPHCKKRTPSIRTLHFWTLPNVIVLQLNRFYYEAMECHKINDAISYPLSNLEFYEMSTDQRQSYDLIGVTSHLGVRPDYGHYVSYARTLEKDGSISWHKYDDEMKSVYPKSAVQSIPEAYVLFYQKKSLDVVHPARSLSFKSYWALNVDIHYNDLSDSSFSLTPSPSHAKSLSILNSTTTTTMNDENVVEFDDDDEFKLTDTMQEDDYGDLNFTSMGSLNNPSNPKKNVISCTIDVSRDMTVASLCLLLNEREGIPTSFMLLHFNETDVLEELFLDASDTTTPLSNSCWSYIEANQHLQLEICDPFLAKLQASGEFQVL